MRYPAIRRFATAMRLAAALGSAVLAVRFAAVAVQSARAAPSTETPRTSERPEASETPGHPAGLDERPDATPLHAEAESVRMTLSVLVGGDRAEVYINGRRLGLSPFVGDVPCKRRSKLKIEVVPRVGPAQTYLRRCRGGVERITQPDPPGVDMP